MNVSDASILCFNHGCDLLAQNRFLEARKEFETAIEYDAAFVEAYINLGNCLRNSGKEDQSLYFYMKAINLDATNALAHFNYGCALYRLDRYKDAADELHISVGLEPASSDIQVTYARYSATIGETLLALSPAFRLLPQEARTVP